MLLGQGMRVLHMLVRTVMVMVMVKVDGVLGCALHPTRPGRTTTRRHRLRPLSAPRAGLRAARLGPAPGPSAVVTPPR